MHKDQCGRDLSDVSFGVKMGSVLMEKEITWVTSGALEYYEGFTRRGKDVRPL